MAIYRLLMFRWAPLIYLATALPAVIFVAYLTPLFQIPGEDATVRRAVRVLVGDVGGGGQSGAGAGGVVPGNVDRLLEAFHPLQGHPGQKLDPAAVESVRTLPWTNDKAGPAAAPDTIAVPPFFALPAAAAMKLGESLGLGIFDSVLAARLVNAIAAVGVGALAIGMARHGRALLFCLLSLPMTLSLEAGAVPDGLLIAAVALVVGLCSRAAGGGRPLGFGTRLLMAVLLGAAVATRPAYVPLLALLLTDAVRPARPRSSAVGFLIAIAPLCLAVAIAAGWLFRNGLPVAPPTELPDMAWLKAEAEDLWKRLPALWTMLQATVAQSGTVPLRSFVGVLGWSDTPIPTPFFAAWLIALGIAAGMAVFEGAVSLSLSGGIAMLVVLGFAIALTFVLPTPFDTAQSVEAAAAIQGRHLLPVAMLLALAIPGLVASQGRGAYSAFGNFVSVLGWTVIFGLAAVSGWLMLPPVLLNRFYL